MPYTPGPFDSQHVYLNWGGKLPGGESWSVGMRLRRKTGIAVEADGASCLAVASGPVAAFHARATTKINEAAKLSFVKANTINVDGRYVGSGTNETVFPDIGGAMGSPIFPNQVAMAATLETGFSRGPAHRGRIYLPMPSIVMDGNGTISAASAIDVTTSCNTLLTQLHDALGALAAPYEVAVFSRKAGAAGNRRVTEFRVGRVLDTQRRRRRSLVEDYQEQAAYVLAG